MAELEIRPATEHDIPLILAFITRIATYERLVHEVVATEDDLRHSLFGDRPAAEVLLGCLESKPVAYAAFFHNFSTFLGRPGLYVEDLYVDAEHRGKGYGRSLLRCLARLARERNCGRLEWSVLDWNEAAIGFYRKLGAVPMDEWTVFRLTGRALQALSEGSNV